MGTGGDGVPVPRVPPDVRGAGRAVTGVLAAGAVGAGAGEDEDCAAVHGGCGGDGLVPRLRGTAGIHAG